MRLPDNRWWSATAGSCSDLDDAGGREGLLGPPAVGAVYDNVMTGCGLM